MSSSNNSSSGGGITIAGLLGVAFVILKLLHRIDWSWWWVTAPFWGFFALMLALLLVVALFAGLKAAFFPAKPKPQVRRRPYP